MLPGKGWRQIDLSKHNCQCHPSTNINKWKTVLMWQNTEYMGPGHRHTEGLVHKSHERWKEYKWQLKVKSGGCCMYSIFLLSPCTSQLVQGRRFLVSPLAAVALVSGLYVTWFWHNKLLSWLEICWWLWLRYFVFDKEMNWFQRIWWSVVISHACLYFMRI